MLNIGTILAPLQWMSEIENVEILNAGDGEGVRAYRDEPLAGDLECVLAAQDMRPLDRKNDGEEG